MPEFQVGDMVRVTRRLENWQWDTWLPEMDGAIGKVGRVSDILDHYRVELEFPDDPSIHLYNYPAEVLELVTDPEATDPCAGERELRVGDRVRVVRGSEWRWWVESMSRAVGRVGTIEALDDEALDNCPPCARLSFPPGHSTSDYWYPVDTLQLVETETEDLPDEPPPAVRITGTPLRDQPAGLYVCPTPPHTNFWPEDTPVLVAWHPSLGGIYLTPNNHGNLGYDFNRGAWLDTPAIPATLTRQQ